MTFRVFGSFYAACTLVLWLVVGVRSLLELKNLANVSHDSLLPLTDKANAITHGQHHDEEERFKEFNTITKEDFRKSVTLFDRTVRRIGSTVELQRKEISSFF